MVAGSLPTNSSFKRVFFFKWRKVFRLKVRLCTDARKLWTLFIHTRGRSRNVLFGENWQCRRTNIPDVVRVRATDWCVEKYAPSIGKRMKLWTLVANKWRAQFVWLGSILTWAGGALGRRRNLNWQFPTDGKKAMAPCFFSSSVAWAQKALSARKRVQLDTFDKSGKLAPSPPPSGSK